MSDADAALLATLKEGGDAAYVALLEQHNGVLACAAHQLVCAKLRTVGAHPPPKVFELYHVAQDIHRRAGLEYKCPVPRDLAAEAKDNGLAVADP